MSIQVTSDAFDRGGLIPLKYTGEGENVSPPLALCGVPDEAKQLALICDDPDAPTPRPWVHWVIYNIKPDARTLPEGVARTRQPGEPAGAAQGKNSFTNIGYGGPMPPRGHGPHHYHFRVYALDTKLDLQPGLDKARLLEAMEGHVIAEGALVGTYQRE